MEGIWIIIFILVMIFKAFKKISEVKANLPKDWQSEGPPPVFREMPFPWEMDEPEEENLDPITVQEPEQPVPRRETTMTEFVMGKTLVEKVGIKPRGKVEQEQSVTGALMPLMDSDNIVNGIIMAELLQPPKCKQRIPKKVTHNF